MKYGKRIIVLCIVVIVSLVGCNNSQTSETNTNNDSGNTFTLKLGHPGAPDHPYSVAADKFKEIVEEESNGSIEIEIYPNNELAAGAKAIESMQTRTIDMALESTMTLANFVPEMDAVNLPFLFPDRDKVYKVFDGDIGEDLADFSYDKGFKILYYWENGYRNISNSIKPINSPEDLEGLKIRVPENDLFISTFETLGAIPTPMDFSELFTALQQGTVDGQENPNGHLIDFNLYEVQDYFAVTNYVFIAQPLMINADVFDEMSDEQQNILLEAAEKAGSLQRELSKDMESEYLKEIEGKEIEITTPDPKLFEEAVQPVYDSYEKELGDIIERIRFLE